MDNEYPIAREGWMRKKGSRVNVWGERYFVLRGPSLLYFLKSTDQVLYKGLIHLLVSLFLQIRHLKVYLFYKPLVGFLESVQILIRKENNFYFE